MKIKKLLILLPLLSVLVLSGCNSESGDDKGAEEKGVVVKEEEVKEEKGNKVKVKEKEKSDEKKVEDNPLSLEITGKNSVHKDTDNWIFSDYVTLDFKVINNTNREIKGATFDIKVKDLFDDPVLNLAYKESELNIPAKGFVEDSGDWEMNQFRDKDYLLFDEPLENLQFELVIRTIIYADGEKEVINDI